jgi:hypothetical protein
MPARPALRLLARAVAPEQRHEGRLAGLGILVEPLARRGFVALMVDQVVGDLEGEPTLRA